MANTATRAATVTRTVAQPAPTQTRNAANQTAAAQTANAAVDDNSYEVLDDLVPPARGGGGGARGSKYMTEKEETTLNGLEPGQGFKIPLMKMDVKDPANRQRYATKFRIDEMFTDLAADGVTKVKTRTHKVWVSKGKDGKPEAIAVLRTE